jgi:hypothetical protein
MDANAGGWFSDVSQIKLNWEAVPTNGGMYAFSAHGREGTGIDSWKRMARVSAAAAGIADFLSGVERGLRQADCPGLEYAGRWYRVRVALPARQRLFEAVSGPNSRGADSPGVLDSG